MLSPLQINCLLLHNDLNILKKQIMLSVCMCARFKATPKESHHKVVKHILPCIIFLFGNIQIIMQQRQFIWSGDNMTSPLF